MTPAFLKIMGEAFRGGVDVSLREIVVALGLPIDDVLGSALEVDALLKTMGLALTPEIARGDFDTRRALGSRSVADADSIRALIAEEEHRNAEFKSTLVCDLRSYKQVPSVHVRSDGVTHSALKTICAFANSGGGRLLIGVEDDLNVCGIEPDFAVMACNRDRWETHLRNLIGSKFWQGRLVNSFVKVEYVEIDGKTVAAIEIVGRRESTFLKHARDDRHEFYIRQGNRSVALDIPEFEQYLRKN